MAIPPTIKMVGFLATLNMIIIAAMTYDRVIGKEGKLPWKIPEDLKKFRELTTGNTVMMGRKTYESIGRPLPNRNNIVISASMQEQEGITVCRTLEDAIEDADKFKNKVFVIGGASIYEQVLPIVSEMCLSYVKEFYEGDTYFPEFSRHDWYLAGVEDHREFLWIHYRRRDG